MLGTSADYLLDIPAPPRSDQRDILNELYREITELEQPAAELSRELMDRLKTIERLSSTLPELKQLVARLLSDAENGG